MEYVGTLDVDVYYQQALFRQTYPCDIVYGLCIAIMQCEQLSPLRNIHDASNLYIYLRSEVNGMLRCWRVGERFDDTSPIIVVRHPS